MMTFLDLLIVVVPALAAMSLRILWPMYTGQSVIALLAAMGAIDAVALERQSKGSEKRFLVARIMASAALVVGIFNAFL